MHTIQIQFQPSCAFPKQIGLLLSLNAGIFTYMFSAFYVHSYNRKPRAAAAAVKPEVPLAMVDDCVAAGVCGGRNAIEASIEKKAN